MFFTRGVLYILYLIFFKNYIRNIIHHIELRRCKEARRVRIIYICGFHLLLARALFRLLGPATWGIHLRRIAIIQHVEKTGDGVAWLGTGPGLWMYPNPPIRAEQRRYGSIQYTTPYGRNITYYDISYIKFHYRYITIWYTNPLLELRRQENERRVRII